MPDASELALSLDNKSVVLSKDNIAQGKARIGDNIITGYGWLITDADFLTITASPTATGGTYEYILEARYAGHPRGVGIISRQLITITVTDWNLAKGSTVKGKSIGPWFVSSNPIILGPLFESLSARKPPSMQASLGRLKLTYRHVLRIRILSQP